MTVKNGTLSQSEINNYIFYTKKRFGTILPNELEIILTLDGDFVEIAYDPPFHLCAYRATDYLVSDLDKLNVSKRAEQNDKIPNSLESIA